MARSVRSCDYIRYTPLAIIFIGIVISRIIIDLPGKDNFFPEKQFDVTLDSNNRTPIASDIKLIKLGPSVLLIGVHIICLLYKLLTPSKDGEDLSMGFH